MKKVLGFLFLLAILHIESISLPIQPDGTLPADMVHPQIIDRTEKLGIVFQNCTTPSMIGYNLDPTIRYESEVWDSCGRFTRCTLMSTIDKSTVSWYFLDGKWVSPLVAKTDTWSKMDSRYFRFICNRPGEMSEKGMASLDGFIERTAEHLGITADELATLEHEKILYYLCDSVESVQDLTGNSTRGVYILAESAIVSYLPCHYHEVSHLLVNFKLKSVPIYTNPFLQEGIATCLGGRAGKTSDVILSMGAFLVNEGMIDLNTVSDGSLFYSIDASLTYPASALYHSQYLLDHTIQEYLDLYRLYSGNDPVTRLSKVPVTLFASPDKNLLNETIIFPEADGITPLASDEKYKIESDTIICKPGWLLISSGQWEAPEESRLFEEYFPERQYMGEEFAVKVSPEEVMVYDFYTGTIIAAYIASLDPMQRVIPDIDGAYAFSFSSGIMPDTLASVQWSE